MVVSTPFRRTLTKSVWAENTSLVGDHKFESRMGNTFCRIGNREELHVRISFICRSNDEVAVIHDHINVAH